MKSFLKGKKHRYRSVNSYFTIREFSSRVCEIFGNLAIFTTSGLVLIGQGDGVQFQSLPIINGSLLTLLKILSRSVKKSLHMELGLYIPQSTNSINTLLQNAEGQNVLSGITGFP